MTLPEGAMDDFADKDPAIQEVLRCLWDRLGADAFEVANLYNTASDAADLYHPANPYFVVHITSQGEEPGRYAYQLEIPPHEDRNELYAIAGRGRGVDFEELARIVAAHLQAGISSGTME